MESYEQRSERFVDWLRAKDVKISPNVKVTCFDDMKQGRGMIAVEDIKKGETLFKIPRSAILDFQNCSLVRQGEEIESKLSKLTQWERLILILLYESRITKEKSDWKPYIDILPLNEMDYVFNQLIFWLEEELKYLTPSLIIQRVGKDIAENMYARMFSDIVPSLGIHELEGIGFDEFVKAATTIMSYSFDVDQRRHADNSEDDSFSDVSDEEYDDSTQKYIKSLVPLADILNADTKLCNSNLMYDEDNLEAKAIKNIKKGDQIYNIYYDHPNSELLRKYGYVENLGSKFDFGEIPLSLIEDYFSDIDGLSVKLFRDICQVFDEVVRNDPDGELCDIVLESYDCFIDSDVTIELIFFVQAMSSLSLINQQNDLDRISNEDLSKIVRRTFDKCYQLIQGKKLTDRFLENYRGIIERRIMQYPDIAKEPFEKNPSNRESMAHTVLKSECQALLSCVDVIKVFQGDKSKYKIIPDEKLLKNILKNVSCLPVEASADNSNKRRKKT